MKQINASAVIFFYPGTEIKKTYASLNLFLTTLFYIAKVDLLLTI